MTAVDDALRAVRSRSAAGPIAAAGVDVHFQPDAPASTGLGVVEALALDGRWRTQFETARATAV